MTWQAKNKRDLIIEVWEKLDCESIGAEEIRSVEEVVRDVYGHSAVESPMLIARLLADEGAELRHSEIMNLFEELYESGQTILLVTHEHDIAEHARRTIVLRDGVIESDSRKAAAVGA